MSNFHFALALDASAEPMLVLVRANHFIGMTPSAAAPVPGDDLNVTLLYWLGNCECFSLCLVGFPTLSFNWRKNFKISNLHLHSNYTTRLQGLFDKSRLALYSHHRSACNLRNYLYPE